MKTILLLPICGLSGLLTNCSLVGLHTKGDLKEAVQKAEQRGLQQGRSIEARSSYLENQAKLEKPQPDYRYYQIPVPAHTAEDGVKIEQHDRTFEITTQ